MILLPFFAAFNYCLAILNFALGGDNLANGDSFGWVNILVGVCAILSGTYSLTTYLSLRR